MKVTKTHLAKLIKEELGKTMRYAENKETGRWEEVGGGVPGGISDLDIMVQDSLSEIAAEYKMPLEAIRDTLNRMIDDTV